MAPLQSASSDPFVRLLYIGDSGTGKTGSLVSLVKAGYKLRILDTDNGFDILRAYIKKECPDLIANVDVESVRDEFKATTKGVEVAKPQAYVDAAKLMTEWSDGTKPGNWGADTFFVLDSMTGLGKAAYAWARGLNPNAKEPRTWYGTAQDNLENIIALLTSRAFECNVIVISHVVYVEQQDGTHKGWASTIGKALGPTIPKYFNNLILAERVGFGEGVKRKIKVVPTEMIDLKTSAPFALEKELPLSSGLADIVKALKAN